MAKTSNEKSNLNSSTYHRIVVKVGTSLLIDGYGHLRQDSISSLVNQIAQLHKQGKELVLVSSGAIAFGRYKLKLTKGTEGNPSRPAMAAVGQTRLMYIYEQLFNQHYITVAQVLLTKTDLSEQVGYLHTIKTLQELLSLQVLCIVNEHDMLDADKTREAKFGENDSLSAIAANLVAADLLIILTNTTGLYTADPRHHPDARLISEVERIDARIESMAEDTASNLAVGGMITKIAAAKMATASGITVFIADGREPDVILKIAAGESVGTRFCPSYRKV